LDERRRWFGQWRKQRFELVHPLLVALPVRVSTYLIPS
jgi:hypothetical protein